MIKTIIFDFGGVLGTDADTIFMETLKEAGVSEKDSKKIWEKHWPKLKNGDDNVNEIWQDVGLKLKTNPKRVIQNYNSKIQVYPEVMNLCKKLKEKRYKLGILANESLEWMKIKKKIGKIDKTFDKVFGSANIKLYKPNPDSYRFVLNALDSKPEETIFIDNLEGNIGAARNLGMTCILYKNLKQLEKELVSLKII